MDKNKGTNWEDENLILDKDDLKRILNVNTKTIYNLFHRQDFPALQLSKRRYAVTKEAFKEWLKKESKKQEFVSTYKTLNEREQELYSNVFNEAITFVEKKMADDNNWKEQYKEMYGN